MGSTKAAFLEGSGRILMGIHSASASFARFHIPEPVTEDFWGYVDERLRAGVFKDLEDDQEKSTGFASWSDIFDSTFAYAGYHIGDYVAFGFRADQRRVAPIVVKQHVRQAVERYRQEHEGHWPSRQEKQQIRDDVTLSLLKRVIPQPAACEVVWNPVKRWLLVTSTGGKLLDAFLEHFEKHFRIYPIPLFHVHWALQQIPLESRQQDLLTGLVSPKSVHALHDGRFLGYEFLTWLWFFSEHGQEGVPVGNGGKVAVSLGERLVLNRPDDGRERIICTTQASALHEARTALQQGKWVQEVQLVLRTGDNEYTLTLDTTLWTIKGLKTPKQLPDFDAEDDEGRFLEKMFSLEEAFTALNGLYGHFLKLRLSSLWEADVLPALKLWIEGKETGTAPF
jgi:DNA recombination-dependent growth factor C